MCEYCNKHTQGRKWFLEPNSYLDELMEDKRRRKLLEQYGGYGLEYLLKNYLRLSQHAEKPLIGNIIQKIMTSALEGSHAGQVVTLKDALKIVDLADDHIILPCYCKKLIKGEDSFNCINFGPIKEFELKATPFKEFKEVDTTEMKYMLKDMNKKGFFHQVISAKMPFPVSLCNCDRTYCVAAKSKFVHGLSSGLIKGHEVAIVDPNKCDMCNNYPQCVSRCHFGAIRVNRNDNYVVVDHSLCFGCGLCVNICSNKAISLKKRNLDEY